MESEKRPAKPGVCFSGHPIGGWIENGEFNGLILKKRATGNSKIRNDSRIFFRQMM
jgi:hypothetical protein